MVVTETNGLLLLHNAVKRRKETKERKDGGGNTAEREREVEVVGCRSDGR